MYTHQLIHSAIKMAAIFHHRNIRLPHREYLGKKAYFLTLCTASRRKSLIDPETNRQILALLQEGSIHFGFAILAYCLMPDHLHFLADGLTPNSDLMTLLKSFRTKSSRFYMRLTGQTLWQKKFHDHILRSTESVESVAWYIWLNPVRAGLAVHIGEFPFAGSFAIANPFREPPERQWTPYWKD
jgi:putative transposase